MIVTSYTICPAAPDKLDALMPEFVRDNAGKAFEFMVEKVDEDRKAAGLGTIAESFAGETRKGLKKETTNHRVCLEKCNIRRRATAV